MLDIEPSASFDCNVFVKSLEQEIKRLTDKIVLMQRVVALTKRHIQRRHHVLSCVVILIGPISGCMTIANDTSAWMRYVSASLALCSGIVSAIIKFIGYEKKATAFEVVHTTLTRQKRRLCDMQQMILARADANGTTFTITDCAACRKTFSQISEKYEGICQEIPDYYIPQYILKYVKMCAMEEGRMSMPVILESTCMQNSEFNGDCKSDQFFKVLSPLNSHHRLKFTNALYRACSLLERRPQLLQWFRSPKSKPGHENVGLNIFKNNLFGIF